MKNLWRATGIIIFWLTWPVWWLYLSGTERTRVAVLAEDRILLVRGWLGGGDWQLPGGGLHKRESIAAGALRELGEETSVLLSAGQLEKIYRAQMKEYGITYDCHCLVAKLPKPVNTKSQKHEITDIAWVRLRDVPKLRISKQLAYTLSRM